MPHAFFADLSPALLGVVGAMVLAAVVLWVLGAQSARRAAQLPAAPSKAKLPAGRKAVSRDSEEDEVAAEVEPATPARPVEPPKPWEATGLSDEAREALKKEAYRQKKAEEAALRERRRAEEATAEAAKAAEAEAALAAAAAAAARARADEAARSQAEAGKALADGLSRTRGGFVARLNGLFGAPKAVDAGLLAELEEVLFSADLGVRTSNQLLAGVRETLGRSALADPQAVKTAIRSAIADILERGQAAARSPAEPSAAPEVWMVVGVNGAGKTTTIGKLAAQLSAEGKKVVLGAADTFRAAATEQLQIWADRAGADLVRGPEGGDPGSVAFEAVKRGKERGAAVVIVDTAGRLHTKAPLMEELKKIKRVLQKAEPSAPHRILLVLDSTNGQNAIAQARQFHEALVVTGVALTKLDGTAKGGVIVGISDELKLPIEFIGVGEAVGDLQRFDPRTFVEALFG